MVTTVTEFPPISNKPGKTGFSTSIILKKKNDKSENTITLTFTL